MRCTGALTVRKARHRERQTAPAGGVPESKRRLGAAPLPRSRLSARSQVSCCSLGPRPDCSRLDSTRPLQELPEAIKRCAQGPGILPNGFVIRRLSLLISGKRNSERAVQRTSPTPLETKRRPAGSVCDPSCPLRRRDREQVHGPSTTSSRDPRRDTVRVGTCSNRCTRSWKNSLSSRTERDDPAPASQPGLSGGDECCIRDATRSGDD